MKGVKGTGGLILIETSLEIKEQNDIVRLILEKNDEGLIIRFYPKVHEIVELKSGEISIRKEPDKITRFSITHLLLSIGVKYRYAKLLGNHKNSYGNCEIKITFSSYYILMKTPIHKFYPVYDFFKAFHPSSFKVDFDIKEFEFL